MANNSCQQSLDSTDPFPPVSGGYRGQIVRTLASMDNAWATIIVITLLLAVIVPGQASASVRFVAASLLDIAPFLLFSALLAGYLEAANADKVIGNVFSSRLFLAIAAASVFGALSPFCSCGVIPLIAALLAAGVPLAAVLSFWVASPIMSPSMFVVTAAGLGIEFAVVKTISAIAIGAIAGVATVALQRTGFFASPLKAAAVTGCGGPSTDKGGSAVDTIWQVWKDAERLLVLRRKAINMTLFLVKWLALAFLLESLMISYVSADLLGSWLGSGSTFAIPLASVIGVPAYLNGFAAVPVVSGLVETGMSMPAALSFMLAGAMTSIPAAIAVYSLVKRPVFVWYVAVALMGAMMAGWAYQLGLSWIA
jgi:uncharacterized membrane protein YraQ (UPF0718 family)